MEQWRPIPGWELYYSVSDAGRVKRTARVPAPWAGWILKGSIHPDGYVAVELSRPGLQQKRFVHRLVLAAFVGPCPDGWEVNHDNGVKHNNRRSNIYYCTPEHNRAHAVRHNLEAHGNRHGMAVLTEELVTKLRRRYRNDTACTGKALAAEHGISYGELQNALTGRGWRHVQEPPVRLRGEPKGDRHYAAELTDAQVEEIRHLWGTTSLYQWQLAERFGVAHSAIWSIVNNKVRPGH